MNLEEVIFVLVSSERDGCYMCDPTYNLSTDIHKSLDSLKDALKELINKQERIPQRVFILDEYDGSLEHNCDISIEAGCISGLRKIKVKMGTDSFEVERANKG